MSNSFALNLHGGKSVNHVVILCTISTVVKWHRMLIVQSNSRHVFSDLRAYVCTSPECDSLAFDSPVSWRKHEMEHRLEWLCPFCNLRYKDQSDTRKHLIQEHGDIADEHHVDMVLQVSSCLPEFLKASDCPFCDWDRILRSRLDASADNLVVPSRRFMQHLRRHLEDFALFVVPEPELEEVASDDGSNAAYQDDDHSILSTVSSFASLVSDSASSAYYSCEGD